MSVLDFQSARPREASQTVFRYTAERSMRPGWLTIALWIAGIVAAAWLIVPNVI